MAYGRHYTFEKTPKEVIVLESNVDNTVNKDSILQVWGWILLDYILEEDSSYVVLHVLDTHDNASKVWSPTVEPKVGTVVDFVHKSMVADTGNHTTVAMVVHLAAMGPHQIVLVMRSCPLEQQ